MADRHRSLLPPNREKKILMLHPGVLNEQVGWVGRAKAVVPSKSGSQSMRVTPLRLCFSSSRFLLSLWLHCLRASALDIAYPGSPWSCKAVGCQFCGLFWTQSSLFHNKHFWVEKSCHQIYVQKDSSDSGDFISTIISSSPQTFTALLHTNHWARGRK